LINLTNQKEITTIIFLREDYKLSFKQQVLALATLPLIIAILVITALVTSQSSDLAQTSIKAFEQNMLQAKKKELVSYTNLALSAIEPIYSVAGVDDLVAQKKAKEIISLLSYSTDGYFFVYDFEGNNLVHPTQPFRVGKNWIDLEDPDGDRVIENLIIIAKAGGGFHPYKWEKPSSKEVADKLSYAVALNKWNWMIGTGLYIDDVIEQTANADEELRENINRTFIIIALITVPAVIAVFLTGIFLNLHERKMADEKLKLLTQRIIDTQEEERSRIARELHDGISQNLVGVGYVLDLAKHKVKNSENDALETIEKSTKNLGDAIKEVRRISHDLRPSLLDDLGLGAALESLTSGFSEHTGINVKLKTVAFKNLLPDDAKTALYRVAQEALTNIERHANASEVNINIISNQNGLEMIIADNGNGFLDNKNKKSTGLGLRNMMERMEHFSGSLKVQTDASGTKLIATMPISIYLSKKENRNNE
jgi:two-component system NarL family sensor kinase